MALVALMLFACAPQSDYVVIEEASIQLKKETNPPMGQLVPGIPSDEEATPAPEVIPTITLPSAAISGETLAGHKCIRVDMTGISDSEEGWITLIGTGSPDCNIWIEVDDSDNKGLQVTNLSASSGSSTSKADISFLIDNSGSMSEEANAVANSISEWATLLASSGLDVQFSCVGYDGAISGGIDFTSATEIKDFLDRSTGTSRTVGFVGANATQLSTIAGNYTTGGGSRNECGVAALRFADENYTYRVGASRVYVNFTDEPNQPNDNSNFSVEYLNPLNSLWEAWQGTVHSVYSDSDTSFTNIPNNKEYPWLMAEYTGGTKQFCSSDFSGVTLSDLPVTGALQNSYIIYFTNIDSLLDGNQHKVVITISTADGIMGILTLYVNFSDLTY